MTKQKTSYPGVSNKALPSFAEATGTEKTFRVASVYLPTLDGWRAVAIVAVMLFHDSLHTFGRLNDQWLYLEGKRGVDVFFAISGILICSRLLDEERMYGLISLRSFYLRRLFRILPAAGVYLLSLAILSYLGIVDVSKSEWWGSVLLCRNYTRILHLQDLTIQAYFTGHFWSLSVEEHFYVVLPALLLFCRGKARVPVMLAIAAAVVLNRCLQLRVRPYDLIAFHTDARLDALMLPAALAVAVRLTSWRVPIRSLLRWWILFAIAAVALVASECGDGWKSLGIAVLMPCAVMGSVLNPSDWVARFLEWTPLRFIGRLSYSLYLWQTLFFTGHFYQLRPLGFLEMFPFNFMATFAIAMASYYCVERPMVKVGHRIVLRIGAVRQQLAGR